MSERVCPSCRKPLLGDAKFCTECGSRIDFQATRRELDEYEPQGSSGLIISKDIKPINPFCTKSDEIRDKILNPELKPLPEKRKVFFKEWKPVVEIEERMKDQPEPPAGAESEEAVGSEISEEKVESNEEEISDLEPEEPAEAPQPEISEELTGFVEEAPTDFEALKALFEENEESQLEEELIPEPESQPKEELIPESENPSEKEHVVQLEDQPEPPTEAEPEKIVGSEISEEKVESNEEESTDLEPEESAEASQSEISEELTDYGEEALTDFEALKALFEENEESQPEEELIPEPESQPKEELIPESENPSEKEHVVQLEDQPEPPTEAEPEEIVSSEISEEKVESNEEEITDLEPEEPVEAPQPEVSEELTGSVEEAPTDFEALKALFEENEESQLEEELIPAPENSPEKEAIFESESQPEEELIPKSESQPEEEPILEPENPPEREPVVPVDFLKSLPEENEAVEETLVELEKQLKESVSTVNVEEQGEADNMKPDKIQGNRVVTVSVGGGFKNREPQAEEVKSITGFFRKNKRR